jgi:hypothetical protein
MDQVANAIIQGMDRVAHQVVGAIHRVMGFGNRSQDVYPFILGPTEDLPLTVAGSGTGRLSFLVPANTTFHLQFFWHQVTSEALLASVQIDGSRINLMNQQVLIEAFSNSIDITDTNERTVWKLPIPVMFRGPANFSVDFTDLSTSTNYVKLYAVGVRDNRNQANASGTHARTLVPINNMQGDPDIY